MDLMPCAGQPLCRQSGKDATLIPKRSMTSSWKRRWTSRILLKKLSKALENGAKPCSIELEVSSTDRTLGTIFGA